MSSPANTEEFTDLESHKQMWSGFTHMLVRGIVGVVILLVLIGWITGVI